MRIKQLREQYGYSQEGIAGIVGMSQTTYSGWEKTFPEQLTRLAALAKHYDVSTDYLLELTNDPTPADRRRIWSVTVVDIANNLMDLPDYRQEEMARAVQGMVARQRAEDQIKILRIVVEQLIGTESTDLIWDMLGSGAVDTAELLSLVDAPLDKRRKEVLDTFNED